MVDARNCGTGEGRGGLLAGCRLVVTRKLDFSGWILLLHCMNGIVGSHVSHAGWLLGLHEPKSVRVTMAPPKLDMLSVCGDDLFGDRKSRFGEGSDA